MTTDFDAARAQPSLLGLSRASLVVLAGCLVCQMGLGFSYVFTTFLKPIVADLGWSRAAFAAVGGPLLLSMAFASPAIGALTDRFGARTVLSLSTLLLAASLFAFAAMQGLRHFYATSLVLGLALTGLGDIPVGAVAARWFSGGRGLALGVVYVGSNLGGSIVPIAATAVAAAYSWRAALVALGVGALVVILPFAAFTVRNPTRHERARIDEASRGASGGTAAPPPPEPSLSLQQALRTRSFWLLGFALLTFYFYYLGVLQHLIAFLSDRGFSDAGAAARFSFAVAVGIAGKLSIGALADRISTRGALVANFAVLTLASFLLLAVDVPGALPAFLLLHGFTTAAENVLLPLIVSHCFGVEHMGKIYGTLMLALFPGGALGPIFAGYVFDTTGSYAPAFTVFAVLNAVALAGLALVRREAARRTG